MAEQGSSGQSSGLAPNVASLLSYVGCLVTGIIFIVIERENKDVRFHAWQSTIFAGAFLVALIAVGVLAMILGAISSVLGLIVSILQPVVWLVFFIFWIVCMIKAYQGDRYKLPIIGDMAEKQAAK